jgi:phospholipid-binding lipoprotein MlaA
MSVGLVKTMATGIRPALVAATLAAALLSSMLLGGCATKDTGAADVWDPIEIPNRFVFAIDRTVDMIAIRPFAAFYRDFMPEKGQQGVHNVLGNLGEPVTAFNEVVQGHPGRAGKTLARFVVNSTIGIVGLFDVAAYMGLEKTKEDMGKTIGYYAGVEPENGGFFLMLPLIGPSNARDGVGLAIDAAVDPFNILTIVTSGSLSTTLAIASGVRYGADVIDTRVRTMTALDDLEKNSVDYYAALRSAYTQQRAELIRQKRQKTDAKAELERRDNLALVR